MQIDETLSQTAAVIPGRNHVQAFNMPGRLNRCLRRTDNRGDVAAVHDDFHYTVDPGGQTTFYRRIVAQQRTEFLKRAGDAELER